MHKRMPADVWDPALNISKETMDRRIENCTSNFLAWQHIARLVMGKEIPFKELRVAEVGSGTGTLSLAFAILGASVTLIDYNEKALKAAAEIYKIYGCNAETVKADCIELPDPNLGGRFDLVISCGLAEHFIGEDLEKCIAYHKYLLKEDGFVCIGVPNKLSPFYRGVRLFREITGTWDLEIEIPFSPIELRAFGLKVGFIDSYVIGNSPLSRDCIDYSTGFLSAVKELLPEKMRKKIIRNACVHPTNRVNNTADIHSHCQEVITKIMDDVFKKPTSRLTNNLSAGIYLFAFV